MADEPFDPEHLEAASFDIVRRGFDPTAVRVLLRRAGEEYHRLRLERDELTGRLAEFDGVATDHLEASQVASALGVEAAQVLEAAHVAAVERAERAEREAEAVRESALGDAESIRGTARIEADEILAEARRASEELVEDGRTRGRDMVSEAQTVRERILGDLARKRQTGRAQVEQLKAARDRLLESLRTVQGSLDIAVDDLLESVPDARAAAERAGLRVTSEPEITADHLEAEIEAARLVGHPLVDDVRDPGAADESFVTDEVEALTDLDDALDDAAEASADAEPVVDADEEDTSAAPDAAEPDTAATEPEAPAQADVPAPTADPDGPELYDVEADILEVEEVEPDTGDEDEPETAGSPADGPGDPEEGTADEVSGVDVLFARLRESHTGEDEPDSDEAEPADDRERVAAADPRLMARDDATSRAVRALKKVLVDEQGTLLDGIRRSGGDAVHALVDDARAHNAPYDDAARPALVALAGDLGADAVDLGPALGQIHSIALDPVRQRLTEITADTDDPDELSDTVRALYRESRSRRLAEAAAAAVVATDGIAVRATTAGAVRWAVHPDGPCGSECRDNELAGEVAPDETFPTGDLFPPSHPACTCRLVPVD